MQQQIVVPDRRIQRASMRDVMELSRVGRAGRHGRDGRDATTFGGSDPTTIFGSSLELWLRADMGITLNGGNVSAWADQSGKGDANRNVSQGTAANQPAYNASNASFANQPTLDFVDPKVLVSGVWAAALAQPATRFVVGNMGAGGTNNYFMDSLSGVAQMAFFGSNGGANWTLFDGVGLVEPVAPTAVSVLASNDNGASSKMYRNALTARNTGNAGTNGLTGTTIGNTAGGGNFTCKGSIAEVIIVSGIATAAQFAACMNYLGARYGVAIGP